MIAENVEISGNVDGVNVLKGGTLTLRKSRIFGSTGTGIYGVGLYANSSDVATFGVSTAVLEDVTIFENPRYGVEVGGDGHVTMRDSQFFDNVKGSYCASSGGSITVEGTVIVTCP